MWLKINHTLGLYGILGGLDLFQAGSVNSFGRPSGGWAYLGATFNPNLRVDEKSQANLREFLLFHWREGWGMITTVPLLFWPLNWNPWVGPIWLWHGSLDHTAHNLQCPWFQC